MRLVVSKYTPDENNSLDCILCNEAAADNNYTVCIFYDETEGTSFVLCPDHLNSAVVAALKRQRDGLRENNPFWYLDPDKDPWLEEGAHE